MPLSVLLVDDEPLARDGLRILLARDADIGDIYDAKNGQEAVAFIRQAPPDLLFLDVQMPEIDGFAAVREIGVDHMPPVVFVTAHDEYAVQAFEINAIDYLLKPVTEARFATALTRVKARLHPHGSHEQTSRRILTLLEAMNASSSYSKRLAIRKAGKTMLLDVAEIEWMQAAENYVEVHAAGATHLLHVTLTNLEKSLDPAFFLRIHRSIIVNLTRVCELQPAQHGEYSVTLAGGQRLQSGRNYSERLRQLAANPF